MTLSIIVAIAKNRAIGYQNQLLWHISEDLKHFKRITSGHTVVMGRKTFESIGKPLPGRRNVVVSRDPGLLIPGCEVFGSIEQALESCAGEDEVFVIGGGEIYRQTLPLADRLYLTVVGKEYTADTFFPEINFMEWEEIGFEAYERGEKFESPFSFITYRRID